MNDRLAAALEAVVARAADAWCTDPADTRVSARLVTAVLAAARTYTPDSKIPRRERVPPPADTPELLDALADTAPATPVSGLLTGHPARSSTAPSRTTPSNALWSGPSLVMGQAVLGGQGAGGELVPGQDSGQGAGE